MCYFFSNQKASVTFISRYNKGYIPLNYTETRFTAFRNLSTLTSMYYCVAVNDECLVCDLSDKSSLRDAEKVLNALSLSPGQCLE